MKTTQQFANGLYDLLLTNNHVQALTEIDLAHLKTEPLKLTVSHQRLADLVKQQLALVLQELEGKDNEKLLNQLALVNHLLLELRKQAPKHSELIDLAADPAKLLKAVHPQPHYSAPELSLAQPWLFTAGKDVPALFHELRHELANCDQVDILVSFITVSGVRRLFDILQSITAVDAQGKARTQLRILTTTYTGATDQQALDELALLPNCTVKVSLDGRRTRLHAKAWIFKRKTGFGSA